MRTRSGSTPDRAPDTAAPAADDERELRTEGLVLRYGRHDAVRGVDVAFPTGRVTAVIGPNGCGKSTLLAGLTNLHRPAAGRVLLDGRPLSERSSREVARLVGLLPQRPEAPEGMTVHDLVRYGRHPHQGLFRQWGAGDEEAVDRAIATAGLADLLDRRVDQLSGGQRQRAWIAMVIAQDTPFVLFDEPTAALDLGHQLEVYELVRDLVAGGRTVVMVLHDLHDACRYADHVVAVHDGHVVAEGPPASVVTSELVARVYGVEAALLSDPTTDTPVVVPIRRIRPHPHEEPR